MRIRIKNKGIFFIVSFVVIPEYTGFFTKKYSTYIYCRDEKGTPYKFSIDELERYE